MQILEEGRLTDNTGFETSFANSIIIATSNIGADAFSGKGSLGFMNQEDSIQSKVKSELEKNFRPELINRFDEIISFNQLRDEDIRKIITLEFRKIQKLLSKKNIKIKFSDSSKDFILKKLNLDQKYGARFTSRLIKEHIYNKIADFILKNPDKKDINLTCTKNGKSIKLD